MKCMTKIIKFDYIIMRNSPAGRKYEQSKWNLESNIIFSHGRAFGIQP